MTKVKAIPEGFHTITPFLYIKQAGKLMSFLKEALGAEELSSHITPDGIVMNAEMKIGTSIIMLADTRKGEPGMPTMLYLYVEDADSLYHRAIKAGGKSVMEPVDQFYGDRSGAFEDPSGNQWWVATRKENLSSEEVNKRALEKRK